MPTAHRFLKEAGPPFKAAVLGASGSVGRPLVAHLLQTEACTKVVLLNRRNISDLSDERVEQRTVDMESLYESSLSVLREAPVDVVFVTLGIGQPSKVSREELERVDVTLPTEFAKAAKAADVHHAVLMTSVGADINAKYSWLTKTAAGGGLYVHLKGKVEKNFSDLNFDTLGVVRPGTLVGSPNTPGSVAAVSKAINWALPAKYKEIRVDDLAAGMVTHALLAVKGALPAAPTTAFYEGKSLFELV